jgi:Tat protein secretion system quality control protein TatD with DNase activity
MYLAHIARVVAQARGETLEQLSATATGASRALFKLPPLRS